MAKSKVIKIDKVVYTCDVCGKEFDHSFYANNCEKSHSLGTIEIATRYDSHDGSEYEVIIYSGEEYRDIGDFVFASGIDFRHHTLQVVPN